MSKNLVSRKISISFFIFNFLVLTFSFFGIYNSSYYIDLESSVGNSPNININGEQYTSGSIVGPTEIITVNDINGNPYLQFERDINENHNQYEDYGKEELDSIFSSANKFLGGSMDPLAAITLIIETRPLQPNDRKEISAPSNGVMNYEWAVNNSNMYPNTRRVVYVMSEAGVTTEEDWKDLWFSVADSVLSWPASPANDLYSYENFLHAVNMFPSYCGIKSVSNSFSATWSIDDICKLQLATTFAHMGQETEFLYWPGEAGALETVEVLGTGPYDGTCDINTWTGQSFPCATEKITVVDPVYGVESTGYPSYKGRGSKQTTWNYNYGPASRTAFGYDDQETLLNDPSKMYSKESIFVGGLEFGNAPRTPKPAMDWLPTGLWEPTQADINAGNTNQFKTTTNIINGGLECRGGNTVATERRVTNYYEFSNRLNVPIELVNSFQSDPNDTCVGDQEFSDEFPLTWALGGWSTNSEVPTVETSDIGPFFIRYPGDYYRALQSGPSTITSYEGFATDWNKGKNANWNPIGPEYKFDVVYDSVNGWVSTTGPTKPNGESGPEKPGSGNKASDEIQIWLVVLVSISSFLIFIHLVYISWNKEIL